MPNTNYQTIHQMGRAINEVVKQATGRNAVQNIDMDHVTVAQTRFHEKVTVEGSIASFTDSVGGIPLEKCVAHIEPVQDLHGYSKPWAGGAGKNILDCTYEGGTVRDVTFTKNTDGTYSLSGTASAHIGTIKFYNDVGSFLRPNTAYILTGCPEGGDNNSYRLTIGFNDSAISYTDVGSGVQFTTPSEWTNLQVFPVVLSGQNMNGKVFKPMLRLATETDPAFEPYSNICPITGRTGVNIHVSPTTDAQDGTTYSITFPSEAGAVYGGTLDVTAGTLTVTTGYIGSYNGETLSGRWISDRDAYAVGTSPSTGAEVVYELANPITYQTTPQEIRTLLGQNNIWANTGDIEVQYIKL